MSYNRHDILRQLIAFFFSTIDMYTTILVSLLVTAANVGGSTGGRGSRVAGWQREKQPEPWQMRSVLYEDEWVTKGQSEWESERQAKAKKRSGSGYNDNSASQSGWTVGTLDDD